MTKRDVARRQRPPLGRPGLLAERWQQEELAPVAPDFPALPLNHRLRVFPGLQNAVQDGGEPSGAGERQAFPPDRMSQQVSLPGAA